jgi:hypothetical protein
MQAGAVPPPQGTRELLGGRAKPAGLTTQSLAGTCRARYNALFARKLHGRILPALFFCFALFEAFDPER